MKIRECIASLLKDSPDSLSSTRFAFLFSVIVSNISIFGICIGLCIWVGEILPIPDSILLLYCLGNSISFGGKVLQKFFEGNNALKLEQNKNQDTSKNKIKYI